MTLSTVLVVVADDCASEQLAGDVDGCSATDEQVASAVRRSPLTTPPGGIRGCGCEVAGDIDHDKAPLPLRSSCARGSVFSAGSVGIYQCS
jgi:hypothetical protein